MYGGQEALEAVEVGGAFGGDEIGFVPLASITPALRDADGAFGCVDRANDGEADLFDEAFIHSRYTIFVKADGAARGDFFSGNYSGDHESVGEKETAAGFEDSKNFGEHAESAGKMAQNIVRENRVESFFLEREI